MSVYLDASFLVAFFTTDSFNARVDAYLSREAPILIVSDFAAAELASAVARRVRMNKMTVDEGRAAFATFDIWVERSVQRPTTEHADVMAANIFLRRLDLNLRTPDALNIAIAQRVGASLATFDDKMAAGALALGTPLASL